MGRIILLGTGDPFNEERAQTSLALPLAGGETLLIDTSSGTVVLRQLRDAGIALDSVRHLFVSHRHFDHAGGLAPLLVALVPLPGPGVTVHAAPETLRALRDLLALTIPGVEGWLGDRLRWREVRPGEAVLAGDTTVTPFATDHGIECVGFRLQQNGAAAVFAADTRPHPGVVDAARGTDLLIHEVYGQANEAETTHRFGHSTAADAGTTARDAGARRLLLTHLRASRFADPAALGAEAEAVFGRPVELARDLDSVSF